MAYTVIGIFEHQQQVDAAVNQLMLSHFNSEDINISKKEDMQGRGDATDENGTLGSKAGAYFKQIFNDEKTAFQYAVVAQQATVLTVHTNTWDDAVRASDILDDCGALNVQERSRMLEDGMTRDERLHGGSGPEIRMYAGLNEYNKDATPAQRENERIERFNSTRSNSSIVPRQRAGRLSSDQEYVDDPDSAYINPSDDEKSER